MKIRIRALRLTIGGRGICAGAFCGEHWYRLSSWKAYPLFQKLEKSWWFSIGPILFWDGS